MDPQIAAGEVWRAFYEKIVHPLHGTRSLELANDKLKEMEAAGAMGENNVEAEEKISADGKVKLSTGEFTIPQLEAVFCNHSA